MSPPLQAKVPFREMAGEVVTIVPSLAGTGSVMTSGLFWEKAKEQKSSGAMQEKCRSAFQFE